ncbi:DUF58 domain-containing protein [Halomonas sp. 1390]|uniref:DUF58 domain-containing protein n=1 Tax=Halomonas sp. B23F22_3 TaxID=3459516 RepID=UPI00373E02D0
MRSLRARLRAGSPPAVASPSGEDPRLHLDLAHLQALEPHGAALRLLPRQPSRSVLNGRHASRLRGRGLDFAELRGYLPGDDVRTLDWRVTARTGAPHVRVYTEERDRPALVVVDQRMSMFFGSRHAMKSVTAAEAAALAAFAVLAQGDRVGGVIVEDERLSEFRPRRQRPQLIRLLRCLAEANAALHAEAMTASPTSMDAVLASVAHLARRDHLILLISDFDVIGPRTETLLGGLSRHNDLVLMPVSDPLSEALPDDLRRVASDGHRQATLDTAERPVREALEDVSARRRQILTDWQRRYGLALAPLSAGEPTLPQLRRLLGLGRRAAGGGHGR